MTRPHPEITSDSPQFRLLQELAKSATKERKNAASQPWYTTEKIDAEAITAVEEQIIEDQLEELTLFQGLPESLRVKIKIALVAACDRGFELGYQFAVTRTDSE